MHTSSLLHDGVIGLRALEPTDLDVLYQWENDTTLWTVTDTVAPYSRQVLWQYLENYTADIYKSHELRLMAVMEDTGEPVGIVDLMNYSSLNNRAEMGLLIASAHRGKGYGERALALLLDYARNHIGLRQLYAYVAADNATCLHLLHEGGFSTVGTLRQWRRRGVHYHDVVMLQRLLTDR